MPANFFPTDPDENAASLANLREVVFACLDAVGAKTVVEVGAFHGKSTGEVFGWAQRNGARLIAIDPEPEPTMLELAASTPELDFIQTTSHEALPNVPDADVVIIDGDHNYFTLSEELRLISERAPGAKLPLLILHDIGWPLARRDAYYVPDRIPAEHRQPLAKNTFLLLDDEGTATEGMPFACVAAHEGGPRNGMLTAVEDFLAGTDGVEFASVPAFFGLGVLWHRDAPSAAAVAEAVRPYDRNPLLERLEANRVRHMVERYRMTRRLERAVDGAEEATVLLRAMEGSRAFAVGEQISRLRSGGKPVFSRTDVRRVLGED